LAAARLALIKAAALYAEILRVAAFRTLEAVRPAFLEKVRPALAFRPKIILKFHERHPYHLRSYNKGA
jgi:hypothetical protein